MTRGVARGYKRYLHLLPTNDNTMSSHHCFTAVRISEQFQAADADVVFISQDNVRFHLHRTNLEHTCGGFPPGEILTLGEDVQLTETAATLELLFSFVYPRRYSSLAGLDFNTLVLLAEAAEKYEVFPAIHICHVRMRENLKEHPIEVLNYSTRHNYSDLVNEAARLSIQFPLRQIARSMHEQILPTWLRYYDLWMGVIEGRDEIKVYRQELHHWSDNPVSFCPQITKAIERLPGETFLKQKLLREMRGSTITVRPCMEACTAIGEKYQRVLERIIDAIPGFDDLLKDTA